ncbi:MAG: GNAT family N-acetyltransferase [Anaerolineae bacterium]
MTDTIIRDLGGGLLLRRAEPADAGALAQFNGSIFGSDNPAVAATVGAWAHDMASCPHPTMTAGDFTIVEDTCTHRIISSLCLISQTWSYAGIPFGVGRPELVGTDPDYRSRGLVRAQFEVIHGWSAERGHLLQGITGIPYYYRQFGYEYALSLGGGRRGAIFEIPALRNGELEPFRVRPAQLADIPFLGAAYQAACRRSLLACERGENLWRYELEGKSAVSMCCNRVVVLERPDGRPIGYLVHAPFAHDGRMHISQVEVTRDVSWLEAAPVISRYLKQYAEACPADEQGACTSLSFSLGVEHPFFQAAGWRLTEVMPPYAWYIRVADIPGFLRHIAPVLEQRLADSLAPGYTGELKLSFFRSGLLLRFDKGKLSIENWRPTPADSGQARFPDLTFLQLLCGFRSFAELMQAFPDCRAAHESALLLNILFPKLDSNVWPFQ